MFLEWLTTLGLIFGGCCSNAITLEQLTSQFPNAGSLITLFQYLVVALYGLPKHITWTRYGPWLKPRRIPITPYLMQVALFYLVSLLNNAAFGYHIPMAVHIIFRSGGLVVSMVLGWLLRGKKYNLTQILSVLLVTFGVILTTLSASKPTSKVQSASSASAASPYTYAAGIGILSLALLFGGLLGMVQDWTYSKYGRPAPPSTAPKTSTTQTYASVVKEANKHTAAPKAPTSESPAWQESMFYLHFLGLPMFIPLLPDLQSQLISLNAAPRVASSITLPSYLSQLLAIPPPFSLPSIFPFYNPNTSSSTFSKLSPAPFISLSHVPTPPSSSAFPHTTLNLSLPAPYLPLIFNTITQLICVAGVHRLTTRVSNLTVTLILVVRKAVSLMLSVLVLRQGGGGDVNPVMMWTGAALVLLGTVGYSLGTGGTSVDKGKKKELKTE